MTPQELEEKAAEAFEDIVKAVKKGNCNLFLGAAVHAPPADTSTYTYPEPERPPIGSGLALLLGGETNYKAHFPKENEGDLPRVAQDCELRKGRPALFTTIKEAVEKGRKPSAALRALAGLGFPVVVTTNYDTLYERALGLFGWKAYVSAYQANDPDRGQQIPRPTRQAQRDDPPTREHPFLFKIHGDIEDEIDSLVVTEEDYIQFVLRMSDVKMYNPIPQLVNSALHSAPTLFVGYSLKDYNLRLLLKTLRADTDSSNFPTSYSVDRAPDPLIWDVWHNKRRYVNFVAWDVWKFVPELYLRVTGKVMPP